MAKYFTQHVRNGLIIHLTNSLRCIKTNVTSKSMINFKNRDRNGLIGQNNFIISCTNKRIPRTKSHDIRGQNRYFTGHEELGKFHFYSENFSLHIDRKTMHFLKTFRVNYDSIA